MDREQQKNIRRFCIRALQRLIWRKKQLTAFEGVPRSVVLLAPERYGDVILLTPLIKVLKEAFPSVAVYVVVFKHSSYEFLRHDPSLKGVYHAKHRIGLYVRKILFRRFDLLFNPKNTPSFTFLWHSLLIAARFKVAHAHALHEGFYDYLNSMDYYSHQIERNLALLKPLRIERVSSLLRPHVPPMPVSETMALFLAGLDVGTVIGINLSASESARYWQEEKWGMLLDAFPDQRFLVFAAPKEPDRTVKARLEKCHANVLCTPPTANLYEAGEIVRRLRLLVTPDTSLVHVASCYNVPLIGLYRNSKKARTRFAPLSDWHRKLVSEGPDIGSITAEQVVGEVKRFCGSASLVTGFS